MTVRQPARLLSAADAERVLGIPASTVRSWWRRRARTQLWDYGRDARNHPLFDELDLVALRDRTRSRDAAAQQTRRAP